MNKYRQWLNEAIEADKLGHTSRSVLKLQARAYDEGYEKASLDALDWDSFKVWYKKRYGWYPPDSLPVSFAIYLKEKRDEEDKG